MVTETPRPTSTPIPIASPTVNDFLTVTPTPEDTGGALDFDVFCTSGISNIRADLTVSAEQLGQLRAGECFEAYRTGVNADGWPWLWMINNCAGNAAAAGFVAITGSIREADRCP